jgi:mRNA interferase MazF
VVNRGDLHWCNLREPKGSAPAKRRPVLVIQADQYNRSRLTTSVVCVLTSNTTLAAMPGNVFLPATTTGLPKDSVVNVTDLRRSTAATSTHVPVGRVPGHLMAEVEHGVRRVLGLT